MQGYEGSQVMVVHGAFKSERTLRTLSNQPYSLPRGGTFHTQSGELKRGPIVFYVRNKGTNRRQ